MKQVLIANRGEITRGAVLAGRKLGLEPVAACSVADRNSPFAWTADRSMRGGPAPSAAIYLNAGLLIEPVCGIEAPGPGRVELELTA